MKLNLINLLIILAVINCCSGQINKRKPISEGIKKVLTPLQEKIEKFLEKSQKDMKNFLDSVGLKSDEVFSKLFPTLAGLNATKIKKCLDMKIEDEEYNFIDSPFSKTVDTYYVSIFHHLFMFDIIAIFFPIRDITVIILMKKNIWKGLKIYLNRSDQWLDMRLLVWLTKVAIHLA